MNLERKIVKQMEQWRQRENRRCLLIKGARQVGKTFSVLEFAKTHYKNSIYINFDEFPEYRGIFDGNLDVDTLAKQISLFVPHAALVPHETLIILDEIQNCPAARTALKFLSLDGRFDVIATGSLLGINYKEVPSFPVGYVDYLEMNSLDFEEFLWANGVSPSAVESLREYFVQKAPVPEAIHNKMMRLFREYIVVGGMPAVVREFIQTNDFANVLRTQREILSDYSDDIAKYAEGSEKAKARDCFLSIPRHLSRDYKKFRWSLVESRGSQRKFGGSLMWLYDAGMILFCHNLSAPELPLEGNAKSDQFKVYMRDTGLLTAMLEDGSQKDIILGNLGIYKGALFENIIADIFAKNGKKLYYFEHNAQIEIDFIIRREGKAVGVEVKSADNVRSKSLTSLLQNYSVEQGIRLSSKNVGSVGALDSFPLYMAPFL